MEEGDSAEVRQKTTHRGSGTKNIIFHIIPPEGNFDIDAGDGGGQIPKIPKHLKKRKRCQQLILKHISYILCLLYTCIFHIYLFYILCIFKFSYINIYVYIYIYIYLFIYWVVFALKVSAIIIYLFVYTKAYFLIIHITIYLYQYQQQTDLPFGAGPSYLRS